MVVIDFVDDPLPEGCSHTLALRIWTAPHTPDAEVTPSAQVLAIAFLEKASAALRKQVRQHATPPLGELEPSLRSGRDQATASGVELAK